MEVVNMHNAKSKLSELVRKVLEGETVIISNNNTPLVELIPFKKSINKRVPGLLKGKIWYSDDCWNEDEVLNNSFYELEIFPT